MAATISAERIEKNTQESPVADAEAPVSNARYIRYLLGFLAGMILMSAIWYCLVIFQLGTPTESSRWINEIYVRKTAMSHAIPAPKLLLVGGSGILFGINAAQIERKTGVPTVNMGIHAGLGMEYLLYKARPCINRGDTVLLSIEYELYSRDEVNDVFLDYLFANDPDYYRSRDLKKRLRYAFALDTGRLAEGCMNRIKHSTGQTDTTEYQSATLNDHGDETNNRYEDSLKPLCQKKQEEGKPSTVFLDHFSEKDTPWQLLRGFKDWCDKRGVTVLATFPNTMYFSIYDRPASKQRFAQLVAAYHRLGITTVGTPQDFIYDRSYFYDTVYHLNDRGVKVRTDRTIQQLEPYIAKLALGSKRPAAGSVPAGSSLP